jgi:hypothetical protein
VKLVASAFRRHLWALKSEGGSDSVTIDLGKSRPFIAWGSVTMVDSLSDFDRDNAYALDIYQVDGATTSYKVYGGDHWGPAGNVENVYEGALVGNARYVRFDLRAKHTADLDVFGVAVVVTLD